MDVSIVIVNWNTRQLLLDCLGSIYDTVKEISFEVFLVDNASTDGSVEAVRALYPQVKVIQNEKNLGFAAANNKALRVMEGDFALLLNTDTILTPGALGRLHSFLVANPKAGMCCGQLLNADGSKQNSVANFPSLLSLLCNETLLRILLPKKYPSKRQEYRKPIEVDSCIGACLMVRKTAMSEVGLLDERYFFFMEETDWALAMHRAGWTSWLVPDAKIYHLQGKSAGDNVEARKMFYRSRYNYLKKWHRTTFPFFVAGIILRLCVNLLLNLFGILFTLGSHRGNRMRFVRYGKLLGWHVKGCPEEKQSS